MAFSTQRQSPHKNSARFFDLLSKSRDFAKIRLPNPPASVLKRSPLWKCGLENPDAMHPDSLKHVLSIKATVLPENCKLFKFISGGKLKEVLLHFPREIRISKCPAQFDLPLVLVPKMEKSRMGVAHRPALGHFSLVVLSWNLRY